MSKTTLKPVNIDRWDDVNSRLDMVIALLDDFMSLHIMTGKNDRQEESMGGILSLLCMIRDDSEKAFNDAWLTLLDNDKTAS